MSFPIPSQMTPILFCGLNSKKKEERIAVIASDNCSGNYHNTITVFFLAWMILRGQIDMFVLHSKTQGHTYFSTDRASGPFKREFNKLDLFSTPDIANLAIRHFDEVMEVSLIQDSLRNSSCMCPPRTVTSSLLHCQT